MVGMESAIAVEGLRKRYGTRTALAGVSLPSARGEIVGLLGPNGAGKSTTLAILATLLAPDEGSVRIAGHPLPAETRGGAPRARPRAAADRALSDAHRRREPALLRPHAGPRPRRVPRRRRARARAGRPRRARRRSRRAVLGRHAAALESRLPASCTRRACCCSTSRRSASIRSRASASTPRSSSSPATAPPSSPARTTWKRPSACATAIVLLDAGRIVAAGTTSELVGASGIASSLSLRTLRPPPADWLDGLAQRPRARRQRHARDARRRRSRRDAGAPRARGARRRRRRRAALRSPDARRRVLRAHRPRPARRRRRAPRGSRADAARARRRARQGLPPARPRSRRARSS